MPTALLSAVYLLRVGGLDVGMVAHQRQGDTARYEAVHFHRGGPARFRREFRWTDDCPPELAALESPHQSPGCRCVTEERTGAREELCVDEVSEASLRGRLDGEPFTARREGGVLVEVTVLGVQFLRLPPGALPSSGGGDPFEKPFPVRGAGGAVRLQPSLPGATQVTVRAVGPPAEDASCLEVARSRVAARGGEVVLGLRVEAGRAVPHAWVATPGGEHQDPSFAPGDGPARYLALPRGEAGRVYLELLAGRRWLESGR